jgi:hypothetical protein
MQHFVDCSTGNQTGCYLSFSSAQTLIVFLLNQYSMPTYTGITGRICGLLWGSLFAILGSSGCLFFLTMLGVLPSTVQQVVVDFTPMTSKLAALTPRRTVPLLLFGVLSLGTAVVGGYGLSEMGKALFETEYSIEVTLGGGSGGGV